MLEAKGFNNVIVSILNDKVDVVVERESLTETEIAQIEEYCNKKNGRSGNQSDNYSCGIQR